MRSPGLPAHPLPLHPHAPRPQPAPSAGNAWWRVGLWRPRAGVALAGLGLTPLTQAAPTPLYTPQGQCAGHPGVALTVPPGWCAGLVADARDGLRMPRRLLEGVPGRFWLVDMGRWEPRRGRLLELRSAGQPGEPGRLR